MARRKSSELSGDDCDMGVDAGGGTVCQRCGTNVLLQALLTRIQIDRSWRERYEASRSASSGIPTIDIVGGRGRKEMVSNKGKEGM